MKIWSLWKLIALPDVWAHNPSEGISSCSVCVGVHLGCYGSRSTMCHTCTRRFKSEIPLEGCNGGRGTCYRTVVAASFRLFVSSSSDRQYPDPCCPVSPHAATQSPWAMLCTQAQHCLRPINDKAQPGKKHKNDTTAGATRCGERLASKRLWSAITYKYASCKGRQNWHLAHRRHALPRSWAQSCPGPMMCRRLQTPSSLLNA